MYNKSQKMSTNIITDINIGEEKMLKDILKTLKKINKKFGILSKKTTETKENFL